MFIHLCRKINKKIGVCNVNGINITVAIILFVVSIVLWRLRRRDILNKSYLDSFEKYLSIISTIVGFLILVFPQLISLPGDPTSTPTISENPPMTSEPEPSATSLITLEPSPVITITQQPEVESWTLDAIWPFPLTADYTFAQNHEDPNDSHILSKCDYRSTNGFAFLTTNSDQHNITCYYRPFPFETLQYDALSGKILTGVFVIDDFVGNQVNAGIQLMTQDVIETDGQYGKLFCGIFFNENDEDTFTVAMNQSRFQTAVKESWEGHPILGEVYKVEMSIQDDNLICNFYHRIDSTDNPLFSSQPIRLPISQGDKSLLSGDLQFVLNSFRFRNSNAITSWFYFEIE